MNRTLLIAASLLFAAPLAGHAWDAVGHQTVANIAFDSLDAPTKIKVKAIMDADPRHRTLDKLSVWPDDIKHTNAVPSGDRHPEWHFADVTVTDTSALSLDEQAAFLQQPNTVTSAIAKNTSTLKNTGKTPTERADALAWIIHLVGDAHQPLHCMTRVTPAHPAPEGDKGGNSFFFKLPPPAAHTRDTELHAYWDTALTLEATPGSPETKALALEHKTPIASLPGATHLNPIEWAEESYALHLRVYSLREGKKPSKAYAKKTLSTSQQRITLAGYRLAGLLRETLRDAPQ
ncbi:MAG: Nuclease [Capsulimonas sp.]|jgi:hypothetical protein|nr:Nuclease [Capsulimonas sp.]